MELTGGDGPPGGIAADVAEAGGDAPRGTRRPWGAAAVGAAVGLLLASAGIAVVEIAGLRRRADDVPAAQTAGLVDLFRLPSGAEHEAFLVPAGPDASGEPRLSEALYPGEETPRSLASLLVANVGSRDAWRVDLALTPLRARAAGGPWEALEPVTSRPPAGSALPQDLDLRLRGLGGTRTSADLAPGTLGQILVALPRGRRLEDLSDVQLGDVGLVRDRLEIERVRRFRADPAGTTSGN